MAFMDARDAVKGNQGTAFMTVNGQVKELFYCKKFEFNADVKDIEVNALGHRITQHKKGMIGLSGSLDIYGITSDFVNMLEEYRDTGKYPYFSLTGTNEDPESSAGVRRMRFDGVSFNTIPLQLIDVDSDVIEETLDVVANDFQILEKFKL